MWEQMSVISRHLSGWKTFVPGLCPSLVLSSGQACRPQLRLVDCSACFVWSCRAAVLVLLWVVLLCCCFCLRTENRARKTHVFGVGWGGGGHVNVPCTSYIIVCYAAEISGIVATLLVTALLMGWGVNVPCTSYIVVCCAAEISGIVATLLVTTLLMGWGGVGWGGGAYQRSLYFVHYSVLRC